MTKGRGISRFLRAEDGSSTIEAVMWIPLFVGFFALVADASFLFFGQNRAYRIVQDANRNLSIGRLTSTDEVESFVLASIGNLAATSVVASEINRGTVTTTLSIPASSLVAVGIFTSLVDLNISVGASHLIEF